jgi:drug/metabolite transporter (DMT)-like permease
LAVLVRARNRTVRVAEAGGSFASAAALFGYASLFSLAYVHLDAGTGALLLFGAVQITMVGWGLLRGERPSGREWVGLIAAIGGLVLLTFPSLSSPPPLPAGAMLAAGIAWGIYSLRGRGTKDALAATASNFARSLPLTASLVIVWLILGRLHATTTGLLLAATSGALASGIGYSLWYAALRHLAAARAGLVQLAVPVVAALGGVAFLGEHITMRLAGAACAILGGIAFATLRPPTRSRRMQQKADVDCDQS